VSSEQQTSQAAQQPSEEQGSDFGQLAALVHAFIGMMNAGGIARMDVQHGDLHLSLRAHELPGTTVAAAPVFVRQDGASFAQQPDPSEAPESSDQHIVRAPMIGTYYAAPAPNEPAFVQVGDVVEEGQTVGIIEAMKIMNEIAADRAGTVVEIIAQNAQTVEYGSPLIRLATTPE
jgi:acetyl-CoA carboxylase biotin carboxyl carrier protein